MESIVYRVFDACCNPLGLLAFAFVLSAFSIIVCEITCRAIEAMTSGRSDSESDGTGNGKDY